MLLTKFHKPCVGQVKIKLQPLIPMIYILLNVLGEDDDEDMVNQTVDTLIEDILHVETCRYGVRFGVPKSREWLATVLPDLDDIRFTQMLRVRRDIFNYICSKIENSPVFHGSNSILQFPVQIQLAVTLFRLGSNGESASIRKIAALFGIGDGGTIDNITKRVFKVRLILPPLVTNL